MVELFMSYWVVCGLIVVASLFYLCNKDVEFSNYVDEYVAECSKDSEISEDLCVVIAAIVAFIFGFIILPWVACKKLKERFRK